MGLFQDINSQARQRNLDFVVIGGLAVIFHGYSRDTADLDLYVYKDGELVALSASGSADEQATIKAPAAGTYDVYVNGFATPGGSTSYGISNFVVTPGSLGNASVTPSPTALVLLFITRLFRHWD